MKNSTKGLATIIVLVVIIIVLAVALGYMYMRQNQPSALTQSPDVTQTPATPDAPIRNMVPIAVHKAAACGPEISSIAPGAAVSFPLTVTGTIDNSSGCRWQMFEGQAGTAMLYYDYQDSGWKALGYGTPVKVDDWTATTTSFSVTLDFNNGGIGIPSKTPMKVVFTAEDASGKDGAATSEFPITLK